MTRKDYSFEDRNDQYSVDVTEGFFADTCIATGVNTWVSTCIVDFVKSGTQEGGFDNTEWEPGCVDYFEDLLINYQESAHNKAVIDLEIFDLLCSLLTQKKDVLVKHKKDGCVIQAVDPPIDPHTVHTPREKKSGKRPIKHTSYTALSLTRVAF